jgi:two-component sensor histidine kinase
VVTELIHNALEHGLEHGGSSLEILLERDVREVRISIIDNGVGLPDGFDLATSSNLGLQIVRTLTENELKGRLVLESTERGTSAQLTFPI